jgi:glutamate-1-semialdehyde 2,1-aminomutase
MLHAILQARLSSSRLPHKVLMTILGKPMLALMIERVKRAKRIDKLIVATSISPDDDAIEALCVQKDVDCFRGSLDDVLDRYYQAALKYRPDHIVRLTGDCPLHDPELIDRVVEFYIAGSYDYVCNTTQPTCPDGQDVWVFSFNALESAWKNAKLLSEREHVCPYMKIHPELFRIGSFVDSQNLSSLRWTVDEPADFEFVKTVYEELYPHKPTFSTVDILALLDRKPSLSQINSEFERDEGFQISLLRDRQNEISKYGLKIPKSLAVQRKAKKLIPGMSQLLSKRVDQFSEGVWPGYYSHAKGAEVWDLDENRYIDMSIAGIGANVLGYADDDVDAAVIDAVKNGTSSSLNCSEEVDLAELLCEIHPWAEKARFTRSGGESMAVAVRIARAHTRRDVVAFCGYHGWHDWYLSANLETENSLGEHLLPGLEPCGVPKGLKGSAVPFRYNNLKDLEDIVKRHGKNIGVIVMEPIRNIWPEKQFIEGVRGIADEIGAVLVVDEITAAFRMCSGGAHALIGLKPDMAVFAKALGNGYPIGAIIGRGAIMDAAQSSFISSTNWTERIGPVAALATIKKHRQYNVGEHLMRCGEQIQKGWAELSKKHDLPLEIGGIPPLSHFTFESPRHLSMKALFVQLMLEKGFLASNLYYAMYAHKQWHIKEYLAAVDSVFAEISTIVRHDNVERTLKGKPANSGFKRMT